MAKSHIDAWAEVSAKYERAQKHINDLQILLDAFIKSNPYGLGQERDIQTGEITYYCSSVTDIPKDIPLIFGDAVHNLRSTLDYIAYKMVERAGGIPGTHTCFPIFDDAQGYAALMPGRVKGLGQLEIEAINRFQPYQGGNNRLWELHQLDIRDKHRLLLTVDHSSFGHAVLPNQVNNLSDVGTTNPRSITTQDFNSIFKPHKVPFPLKAGDKLGTVPIAYAYVNVGFVIDVAINEPGLIEGAPLTLFIQHLSDEVGMIMRDLARFL